MIDFNRGAYARAADELRVAAFGRVDDIPSYITAEVYLAVTNDRLEHYEDARTAAMKVLQAERITPSYAALKLPPDVRASFEQLLPALLTRDQLANVPAFARLASQAPAVQSGAPRSSPSDRDRADADEAAERRRHRAEERRQGRTASAAGARLRTAGARTRCRRRRSRRAAATPTWPSPPTTRMRTLTPRSPRSAAPTTRGMTWPSTMPSSRTRRRLTDDETGRLFHRARQNRTRRRRDRASGAPLERGSRAAGRSRSAADASNRSRRRSHRGLRNRVSPQPVRSAAGRSHAARATAAASPRPPVQRRSRLNARLRASAAGPHRRPAPVPQETAPS